MKATYKDNEELELVENAFSLEAEQKQQLLNSFKKITKSEHQNLTDSNKIRTRLSDEQKEAILSMKNSIIELIKDHISNNDSDELVSFLKENMLVTITQHAQSRLIERFNSEVEEDSPFSKLMNFGTPTESIDDLENDAINVLIESDLVGDRVEWSAPKVGENKSFPRINFHQYMHTINVITEIRFEESENSTSDIFIIITVIKKD